MKKINKTVTAIVLSVFVVSLSYLWINFNGNDKFSNNEIQLLKDYSSIVYEEYNPTDYGLTKTQQLDKMNVSEEKRKEYQFEFYKLKYKNLNEIHAKGISENGNCYNVAITNVDKFFDQEKINEAGLLLFQVPVSDDVHTCEGDPCNSCEFTRDENGEINGCNCNNYGKCNHTVTSG